MFTKTYSANKAWVAFHNSLILCSARSVFQNFLLFPKMGQNDSSALRLAVLGTSLIGAGYIAVTYFASEFVVNAIGGSGYAELYSEVWLFAIEGSLFAVLKRTYLLIK